MREKRTVKSLSDDALLRGLSAVLGQSRRAEADVIEHIAEVDARRLYAREAMPSMFAYCTERLHLSEPETGLRIHVARACRKHPMLLGMLRDGRIHLSGIGLLAPHLTQGNRQAILKRATHRSKRQIEELVAELKPRPDAAVVVRRLPVPQGKAPPATEALAHAGGGRRATSAPSAKHRPDDADGWGLPEDPASPLALEHRPDDVALSSLAGSAVSDSEYRPDDAAASPVPTPGPTSRVEPVAPARFRVHFTATDELRDKLERLKALMRCSVPDGDLAKVIDVAVTREIERLEAKRFGRAKKPRKSVQQTDTAPRSRHIPAAVRRAVHERDKGQCAYVDRVGRRCKARDRLEFHHHGTPFGLGGDHRPENIRLMCRTHNALLAEQEFGKKKMAQYRRKGSDGDRVSETVTVYGAAIPERGGRGTRSLCAASVTTERSGPRSTRRGE